MAQGPLTIELSVSHVDDLFVPPSLSPFSPAFGPQGSRAGMDYAMAEIAAHPASGEVHLRITGSVDSTTEEVVAAIDRFTAAESRRLDQEFRATLWRGIRALAVAVVALVVFIWLSKAVDEAGNAWREILSEGLAIAGWVALWFPLDTLFFDVWAHRLDRRTLRRLSDAEISVVSIG